MHYKDGTEAKVGHHCRFPCSAYQDGQWVKTEREGVIVETNAAATTCNARVAYPHVEVSKNVAIVSTLITWVTLGECQRAEMPLPAAT